MTGGKNAKRIKLVTAAAAAVSMMGAASARAASSQLIESFENTTAWSVVQGGFSSPGFSTTQGVTDGTYSWIVAGTTAGPDYSAMLSSPSSLALTQLLGGQASSPDPGQAALAVSIDVKTPPGSFGFFQQWDMAINNADTGYVSTDGYAYNHSPSIGNQSTLTFNIPSTISSVLATSTNPTTIVFQIGGGFTSGNETMYIDNVQAVLLPPTVLGSETSNWKTNGGGAWETGTNWNSSPDANTPPGAAGSVVTFDNNGGAITVNPTVTLASPAQADIVTFGSGSGTAVNYTINSGGSQGALTVNFEMDALSGTNVINVPVGTGNGSFHFDTEAGASLTIPNFTDTSFGAITQVGAGTLVLGTSLHCSVTASGTFTFLDNSSGGFLFGLTVPTGSTVNLGKNNTWNNNTLNGDASGGGVINVPSGAKLFTAEYPPVAGAPFTMNYSGSFSGSGSIVIGEGNTATDTSQIIYGNTAVFFGNDSAFSGTITVGSSFPPGTTFMISPAVFTLQVGAANVLGDGSATNQVILDGGILQTTASFTAAQTISITAKNGTIDTNGNNNAFGVIGGAGGLTKISAGTLTLSGANTYAGNTTVSGGTLTLNAGGSLASANVNVASGAILNATGSLAATATVNANGVVNFGGNTGTAPHTQALAALNIGTGVTATIASSTFPFTPATVQASALTLADLTSKIDVNNNILIAPGTAASALGLITSGQVFSSAGTASLGYIAAGGGNFEIRWTLLGDTNLDGKVNVSDLGNLATNFGSTSATWIQGDFDRSGTVNVADLGDLATNFGQSLAAGSSADSLALASSASASAVPEPATLAVAGICLVGLMGRRRRR